MTIVGFAGMTHLGLVSASAVSRLRGLLKRPMRAYFPFR